MSTPELSTETIHALMPFAGLLGAELVRADPQQAVVTMAWRADLTTVADGFHGGALMGLADSSGAVVAFLNLPEGAGTSTISSNTVFLRGARSGTVSATSTLVHAGRTTIVVETTVTGADGLVLSRTTQTQAVLAPRP